MSETEPPSSRNRHEWFVTTRWSVVRTAGHGNPSQARVALNQLCQTYWYPLYAFVRRSGYAPQDAEDLVQAFFARCIEKSYLEAADQAKGRFRSFLLVAFKRFLAHEWAKARTQKRGRAQPLVALDALSAEQRYALEPADHLSADKLFERRWALTLLERVLDRLQREQAAAGHSELFARLKESLTSGSRGTAYAELAASLGTSEGAVKVAVHRLRKRYRELLLQEIAHTVSSPEEAEEERRFLFRILSR